MSKVIHITMKPGTELSAPRPFSEMTNALWFWDESRLETRFHICMLLGYYQHINPYLWGVS